MTEIVAGTPSVTVIIPTFGRPQLVCRAVRCALDQTLRDMEVLVVIDGDDPATVAGLSGIDDARLRWFICPEKRGAGGARDTGASMARGDWVAFLDDDDEWLGDKLEKQMAAVQGKDKAICMTLYQVVSPTGSIVYPTRPYEGREPVDEWLFGRHSWLKGGESMLQTSALLMPRSLFDVIQFGRVRHEEWELVIRAVKQLGYRLVTVKEPLVIYYTGNSYPWRPSAAWVDDARSLISPRAYSGFCLTVATQGLAPVERNHAMRTFLTMALRNGRPTAKQLFAFGFIWLFSDRMRHSIRSRLSGLRGKTR